MGMDIYGLNPVLRDEKPTIDYDNSTEEQRTAFWERKDKWEQENPGYYFRANIWSWRPIAEVILACADHYKLGLPTEFTDRIHENSGAGLKTQDECNILANFLENYVSMHFEGWDSIGLNTGWYYHKTVGGKGSVITTRVSDELAAKLSTLLHDQLFVKNGEFECDGFLYTVSHMCDADHVREFISFLRECGGFEIL